MDLSSTSCPQNKHSKKHRSSQPRPEELLQPRAWWPTQSTRANAGRALCPMEQAVLNTPSSATRAHAAFGHYIQLRAGQHLYTTEILQKSRIPTKQQQKLKRTGCYRYPKLSLHFCLVWKASVPSYHPLLRNVTKLCSYLMHASGFADNTKDGVTQSFCSQKKGK